MFSAATNANYWPIPGAVLVLLGLLFFLAACAPEPGPEATSTPIPRISRTRRPTPTSAGRAAGTATAQALASQPTATPLPTETAPPLPTAAATPTERSRGTGSQPPETVQDDNEEAGGSSPQPTRKRRTPTATPTVTATLPPNVSSDLPATRMPLTDMGDATYFGFEGGLYPGGSNRMPQAHAEEGAQRGQLVQPLDTEGNPDPEGKIVFLSIGLSVTTMEFCVPLGTHSPTDGVTCRDESFVGLARKDDQVNLDSVFFLNGAYGGQVGERWDNPEEPNYDRISQELMSPLGVTEAQVQVVWLKVVNSIEGKPSLPAAEADAFSLMATQANIVRALHSRYPNLQQVFLTSRNYAGYTNRTINPEPYAFETGFAVKWLIEAQIRQMATGEVDPIAGDLDYHTSAPWLAWGPYIWADGMNPRSDGVFWTRAHFGDDGTHPSVLGRETVGAMLLDYFKSSPFTRCWFLAAQPACSASADGS